MAIETAKRARRSPLPLGSTVLEGLIGLIHRFVFFARTSSAILMIWPNHALIPVW
jgi:hypothetical protein